MPPEPDAPDLARLAALVAEGDPAAADLVEDMALRLLALARRLRSGSMRAGGDGGASIDDGGMGDRVTLAVAGPDGAVKRRVRT